MRAQNEGSPCRRRRVCPEAPSPPRLPRGGVAHIRQSRPDSGLGFQVKVLKGRFWPGLSGKGRQNLGICSLFARQRCGVGDRIAVAEYAWRHHPPLSLHALRQAASQPRPENRHRGFRHLKGKTGSISEPRIDSRTPYRYQNPVSISEPHIISEPRIDFRTPYRFQGDSFTGTTRRQPAPARGPIPRFPTPEGAFYDEYSTVT